MTPAELDAPRDEVGGMGCSGAEQLVERAPEE
jgi:hypothetical protein